MTLTDAGPLIAIIDADEPDHDGVPRRARPPRPALGHDVAGIHRGDVPAGESRGFTRPAHPRRLVQSGRLVIEDLSSEAVERSARLMDQYADRPMDLADATLVALAEERGHRRISRRIFTLDADFHIYRIRGRQRFETIPPF